jgi:thioredoxin-like negative regulator of GroEL
MLDSVIDVKDGAVELAKVDIDDNAELAMEYGVCLSVLQLGF